MTVDLHLREAGSGRPLVLLHAFPLSSAMWLEQRNGLAEICRVITPDLRGFGGSPLPEDSSGQPSLDDAADDIAALLDRLGLDRVVLGGLSMGGYVAMAFLRRHRERVEALVLADTRTGTDSEKVAATRERIAEAVLADPDSPVLLEEVLPTLVGESTVSRRPLVLGRVRALLQAAPPAAVAWAERAMLARPDSAETLRATDVPALVVVGSEDSLAPVEEAQAMADVLPQSSLVVLPDVGHLSAVEDPAAFNAALRTFLADG